MIITNKKLKLKNKKLAVGRIQFELQRNDTITKGWVEHHNKILNNLNRLLTLSEENLQAEFAKDNSLNFALLTNERPIYNEVLGSTAWETARSTGIIEEFNFESIEFLTRVYVVQDLVLDNSLKGIGEVYFERESHNVKNIITTLTEFQIRFRELD